LLKSLTNIFNCSTVTALKFPHIFQPLELVKISWHSVVSAYSPMFRGVEQQLTSSIAWRAMTCRI